MTSRKRKSEPQFVEPFEWSKSQLRDPDLRKTHELLISARTLAALNKYPVARQPIFGEVEGKGVLRVLSILKAATEASSRVSYGDFVGRERKKFIDAADKELIEQANQFLRKYPVIEEIRPTQGVENDHVVNGWSIISTRQNASEIESIILHELISLAKAKRLDHIRQCVCGRWFLAAKSNQFSHDSKSGCRQKRHRADNQHFKARRRLYMRWRYESGLDNAKETKTKLSFSAWLKQQSKRKQARKETK